MNHCNCGNLTTSDIFNNLTNTDTNLVATIIGYVGTCIVCGIFIPQVIHMIKIKSGDDLSYVFLTLNLLGALIWAVYGTIEDQLPLLMAHVIVTSLTILMIILKYIYSKKKKT